MRGRAVAVSALTVVTVGLALACTVDRLVGENATLDGGAPDGGPDGGPHPGRDGGTPICPGTEPECQPVCGSQICEAGCTGLHDCVLNCSGTSCSFTCEGSGSSCSPSCEPGPCQMECGNVAETVTCTMNCAPPQTCKADCHDGGCTVACGDLVPATVCDAGVYSCSGTCPP